MDKQKVIAVVGPTASGKSKVAIELAKKLNGEIISADSMQVYKKMDIGTAKAMPEEQEGIKHYLIDVQDYSDPYNVMIFQEKCRQAIDEISVKGKLPIIAGGTGLYLKAAMYDYEFEEEKEDLSSYIKSLETISTDELYQMLQKKDLKTAEKIHPNNRRRIERALAISLSGTNKSDREEAQMHQPIYDVLFIGLDVERPIIHERIAKRVDKMFDEGLVEEVESLFKNPKTWEYTSFAGIGYKEFKDYFEGQVDLEKVKEQIKTDTRRYCRRQMTWFRHQMPVEWFTYDDYPAIEKRAEAFVNGTL